MSSNDALGFPTNKKLMLWDDGTWCLVNAYMKQIIEALYVY